MFRNSLLWTASKIALFLLLFVVIRPIEATEYLIGVDPDEADNVTKFVNLEAFRIQVSNRTTDGVNDGDIITLYSDDHSLTDELYLGYNVAITFRSSDPEDRRTVTPAEGAQTRFMYMDGSGSIYWSTIYFEGIEEMSGFDDRGNSSSGGGIIYAWWNQYIYTQDGKGVTFKDNFSQTGTGGGVVYYWDAIECDFTDSNFINNKTTGAGGALFINASTTLVMTDHTDITIGASDGNVSTFSGNMAGVNYDGTGGYLNSIDFTGGDGNTANLYIKTQGTGVLDMRDPFRTQAGFGGNYFVNIIKTGAGTWKLGGDSVVSGSSGTKIEIQEGTLEFYRNASLNADGDNDSFTVMRDAMVKIVGGNRIQGTTVTFQEGSILAFDMGFYFTVDPDTGRIPTKDTHMLELAGGLNITKTTVDILNLPTDKSRHGDYTLIESDKDIQGGDFTLLFNGAVIETTASDRLGYGLVIPEAAKNTLVLHVGETFNTVLVWNNADTERPGQWSYDGVNWYDEYIKKTDEAFIPNDSVIFDLEEGGTITLNGTINVSKDTDRPSGDFGTGERGMRVSGSGDWTFNSGSIADTYTTTPGEVSGPDFLAALIFDGSGTLTLNNDQANAYHDGTYISGGGTIVAKNAGSLGSAEFAGQATTGRLVQDEGYGIMFSKDGGAIRFQSGTIFDLQTSLPTSGVLEQRISVAANTAASIALTGSSQRLVITTNPEYQNYAADKNGGAVNVGQGGSLTLSGSIIFAQNMSIADGGAVYGAQQSKITAENVQFGLNEADRGGAVFVGEQATVALSGSQFHANTADLGGAIYAANRGAVTANASNFTGNEATRGGAIYHAGNSATAQLTLSVQNTVFGADSSTGNKAGDGGAIYLADGRRMTLDGTRTRFYGNEATTGSGGAIYVGGDAISYHVTTLDGATFEGNSARSDGGAIYLTNFEGSRTQGLNAAGVTFKDNTAETGYGGAIRSGNNVLLDFSGATGIQSTFSGNTAGNSGGAIAIGTNAEIRAETATFTNNQAALGGGAVYALAGSTLRFDNATFTENTVTSSQGDGGAIYADSANITANRATFHDNGAPTDGGDNEGRYGGAIYLGTGSTFEADDSEFLRNRVLASGSRGGAIYALSGGQYALNRTTFRENSAMEAGGAIYIGESSTGRSFTLNMTGSTFDDNSVESRNGEGGAIYVAQHGDNSSLIADGTTFQRNTAGGDGGAVRVFSGVSETEHLILSFARDESANNSSFKDNSAGGSGGAVYAGNYVTLTADHATFETNTAVSNGGAIRIGDDSTLKIASTTFTENTIGSVRSEGGAVYAGNDVTIVGTDARFFNNGVSTKEFIPSYGLYGGAVRVGNDAVMDFSRAEFNTNIVNANNSRGGALYAGTGMELTIDAAVFGNNSAKGSGGAIDATNQAGIFGAGAQFGSNIAGSTGGAISVNNEAVIELDSGRFTANTAGTDGGAIYAANNAVITGSNMQFGNNTAQRSGGAIFVNNNDNDRDDVGLELTSAKFTSNKAETGDGGAIAAGTGVRMTISGTNSANTAEFSRNSAGGSGGAVSAGAEADLTFGFANFSNNTAANHGGAVRAGNETTLVVENTTFNLNQAGAAGGAVNLGTDADLRLSGAVLTRNTAGTSGGAVHLDSGSVTIDGSNLSINTAGTIGGAVRVGAGTEMTITASEFGTNKAGQSGGAVHSAGTVSEKNRLEISGTVFQGNIAEGNSTGTGHGGAVYAIHTTFLGSDWSTYSSNSTSGSGGAIYAGTGTDTSQFDITGSVFSLNSAGDDGGALYFAEFVGLNADAGATTFHSNSARSGGAIYALAGGTLKLDHAQFTSNRAGAGSGGAILLGASATGSSISGSGMSFIGNRAQAGSGGAIYVTDADLDFTDVTFLENSASQNGGAILYETNGGVRSINFNVGVDGTSIFSGNTAGNRSSAIHFVGKSATTINMGIDTDEGGAFELYDALTVDTADNAVELAITKTGAGTWKLGNVHDLRGTVAATVEITEGVLDMQQDARLLLDSFSMMEETELILRGDTEIAASEIIITDDLGFDLNGIVPDSESVALTLTGAVRTVSGNPIGSGIINVTDFVELSGVYNLVKAEGVSLADTGTLQYKGVNIVNNDRLQDYWDLSVDTENSILQLELRPWENTEMTWTGQKGNFWNMEERNWKGVSEGINVDQFIDGDSVLFTEDGAGVVQVSPNDVVVNAMLVDSEKDYEFQGGTITGNTFAKYGSGSLTMSTRFEFDTFDVYGGTLFGGLGSDWALVGNLNLYEGSVFRPTDKFRVDGNIAMHGGSSAQWELGTTQSLSSAVTATGTINFDLGHGNVTIFIDNNGLSGGQFGTDAPILLADEGLTLDGETIDDGVYGVNRRVVQIVGDNGSLVLQSDRSMALQAAVIGNDSTELSLIAYGTGFGAAGPTSDDFNNNQMAVYEALENAPYQSLANTFFGELAKLGTVEEKAEALNGMVITVSNAAMLVAERNLIRAGSTIFERVHLLGEIHSRGHYRQNTLGQSPYQGSNFSPWFTNLGDFQDQNDSRKADGFQSKMYGFMLGVDRNYGRDFVIGLGLSGTFATVDGGRYQTAKADTYMASIYGAYIHDGWTLTGNAGYASSEFNFKRRIFTVDSELKQRGNSFVGGVELSKKFRSGNTGFRPYGSLQFVSMDVGDHVDRSLGVLGNVKTDSGKSHAALQTLGVKIGREFTGSRGAVWMPSFTAAWLHDYGKGSLRSTTTFGGGTPFTVIGAERARDRMLLGIGSHIVYRHLTFFGSFDGELSGRYSSQTLQLGLNFVF